MDTTLNHSSDRHTNFGLDRVADHILKLFLGLDLVIEHTECNIFQERKSVFLPINCLLFVHNRYKEGGFLIIKWNSSQIALFGLVFLIIIMEHLVVCHEKARDSVFENDFVNLACLERIYRFY